MMMNACDTTTAVHYEQGEYEKCIEVCLKAVEVGREHRADFKLVAKLVVWLDGMVVSKIQTKH